MESNINTTRFNFEISRKTFPLDLRWFFMRTALNFMYFTLFLLFLFVFIMGRMSKDNLRNDSVVLYSTLFVEHKFETLIVFIIVVLTFSIIATFIYSKNYKFSFWPESIDFESGFTKVSKRKLLYKNIQDVCVCRSWSERLFGISSVLICDPTLKVSSKNSFDLNFIKIEGLKIKDANRIIQEFKNILPDVVKNVS